TAVVVKENGDQVLRETFPTTEGNLVGFLSKVDGEKHLTFEECHLAQWLFLTLREEVDHLLVCNPVYVAKKQGAKTDYRDALHLAQELRGGHLKPVYHDDSKWIELRTLVNSYSDLVDQIVATKNRLKAVFRSHGLSTQESDFYKTKERARELPSESAKFVAENLFSQIENLEGVKEQYKIYFHKNKQRYKPIKNLCSIPGIDIVRANIIVAIICMPHRFKNKHAFWGYSMLVRHIQMSGGKIYGNKRIHGRRELRDVFIGAAENALRGETSLRDYYDALRAKGAAHKEAKLSLARKIAALALSLLKNNDTFKNNYESIQQEKIAFRKTLNLDMN
ncbi:MAG: transposase, partial [Taibaiella sp.]|nr:transposase [Taibaiella sp.]